MAFVFYTKTGPTATRVAKMYQFAVFTSDDRSGPTSGKPPNNLRPVCDLLGIKDTFSNMRQVG
jgi:hypothetical protein